MSSTAVYAKFIHSGRINTVALMEDLPLEEVSNLLKTVFNISGTIVGILAEKGMVIPISLVCKSPQVIPNGICKILVGGMSVGTSTADEAPKPSISSVAANVSTKSSVDSAPMSFNFAADGSQATSDAGDSPVEQVIQEILIFLQSLKRQEIISHLQFTMLQRLLRSNSTLLFAAYSVAISANDSEYFAEIAKDLANSLLTEQGRLACEAQDEVLQVCDQLFLNERITENQLLYLRHLVLIREEAVASVYDEFQEKQSVPLLAKALFDLANSHPFQRDEKSSEKRGRGRERVPSVDEDRGSEGLEEDEEDFEAETETERDGAQSETATQSSLGSSRSRAARDAVAARVQGLTGVASLLSRAGVLSKTETNVLFDMISAENEFVLAAYELYEQNRDLDELQDTLERCVRLEIRKRVTDLQERELDGLQRQRQRERQIAQAEAEADEVLDEDESKSARDSEAGLRTEDEDERESEEEDEDDYELGKKTAKTDKDKKTSKTEDEDDFGLEDISLDAILQSLGVAENRWRGAVPEQFVQTVFIAVIRAQLEREQAVALCDLFLSRYDLVLAAWEVFLVQRDALDFVDTLRRAVRDLDLTELQSQSASSSSADKNKAKGGNSCAPSGKTSSGASVSSTATVVSPRSLASSSSTSSPSSSPEPSQQTSQTATASAAESAKRDALQAVQDAKRELLKHSLEMMVKQGLATAQSASSLYARYLQGDALVEAAIEAYAGDRDVAEFLDTLQILAAHSAEEIDALMKSAAAAELRKEQEEEKKTSATPTRTELALMQITDIVKEMLKTDLIGPAVAEAFQKLIQAGDARLVRVYEQYLVSKNGAELVDGLLHVVIDSVEGAPHKQQQQSSSSPSPARASPNKPSAEREEAMAVLDKDDQRKIVEILYRARAISLEQCSELTNLIEDGNVAVSRIFSAYESNKNVMALMDSLQKLNVTQPKTSSPAKTVSPQKSSPQKSPVLAEEEEESNDEEDEENDGDFLEARFMQIVQTMKLSDLETAALRLAIAESDPAVRDAIEQFREGLDEQRLVVALRNAARGVIQRTLSARHGAEDEDDEEEEQDDSEEEEEEQGAEDKGDKDDAEASDDEASEGNEEDASEDDHNEGEEDEEDNEETKDDNDDDNQGEEENDNEDEQNDDEDEEDDGDKSDDENEDEEDNGDEDFSGESLITPQIARESVFPILVNELVKEGLFSKSAGQVLLDQFKADNNVINAALDVYDRDTDMARLVDTLQGLVDNLANN